MGTLGKSVSFTVNKPSLGSSPKGEYRPREPAVPADGENKAWKRETAKTQNKAENSAMLLGKPIPNKLRDEDQQNPAQ